MVDAAMESVPRFLILLRFVNISDVSEKSASKVSYKVLSNRERASSKRLELGV